MASKNTPEVETQQKVQTRYDRKIEARKLQKQKEARQDKLAKIAALAIGIIIVIAIVVSIAMPIIKKQTALTGTYVKIGDYELSQLEYEYYYNTVVNNYLYNYASILPYMGLDTSTDFSQQQYSEDMTWKDMFDQMTVEQIRQSKAMLDDAKKAGFSFDPADGYESFVADTKTEAEEQKVSIGEFYKKTFGEYATEKNIEGFVKDSLLVDEYYNSLLEKNAPGQDEIKAYYQENKKVYDKVDYRSFTFSTNLSADATDAEKNLAMEEAAANADEMAAARKAGTDFEELCLKYATEDTKENYEDPDTEYSLSEGRYYSNIATIMADWLYADGRKEGDITVLEDENSSMYYVVEFVARYYDEADDETIKNTIASERVSEYSANLVEDYPVTDVKGELKYLTVSTDEATGTDPETSDEATGTDPETSDETTGTGSETSDEATGTGSEASDEAAGTGSKTSE